MKFKPETILSALNEMGHIGQLFHLGYDMDGDEVFDSLIGFGVTIKIDKDVLINKLKAKESESEEWRGVPVEEPEIEPEVVDEEEEQHGEVEDKE